MKRSFGRHCLAILMAFTVMFTMSFAITGNANAASGKTYYFASSVTVKDAGGQTYTTKYSYYDYGLIKSMTGSDGYKEVFTRNKKGYNTGGKVYDGKMLGESWKVISRDSKGRSTRENNYDGNGNFTGKASYTYYSNGMIKESGMKSAEGTHYYAKYDKYFNLKLQKWTDSKGNLTCKRTYKLTYEKGSKGRVKTAVVKETTYEGRKTISRKWTVKYTYKTNSHGKITRRVEKATGDESYTEITTIKYKKVTLDKKYRKLPIDFGPRWNM